MMFILQVRKPRPREEKHLPKVTLYLGNVELGFWSHSVPSVFWCSALGMQLSLDLWLEICTLGICLPLPSLPYAITLS